MSRARTAVRRAPLPPGEELVPGYRVVAHLRRGSRLDVYDIWSEERSCHCVAKALRPDRAAERDARRDLRTEARLLLACTHPHLVRAYELVETTAPVLVLETITGPTVEDQLEQDGRLATDDLVHLGLHLSSALGYLHRRGVLHRDVKPSNVISERGTAKLIDLSIACRVGHRSKGKAGTRPYMAPEQVRGGVLREPTDVWGLGALLYEAATGRPAFDRVKGEFPQLAARAEPLRSRRRLRRELGLLIDACLAPAPAERPSVSAISETLLALVRSP